jgi:hypothetical protein
LFSVPVSKLWSFAVAVCGEGPLFDQVIVSPTLIVVVAGVNLKSEIVTPGSPAARARRPRWWIVTTRFPAPAPLRRRPPQWWRAAVRSGVELAGVLADAAGAGPFGAGACAWPLEPAAGAGPLEPAAGVEPAVVVVVVATCVVVVGAAGAGAVLVSVAVVVVLVVGDVVPVAVAALGALVVVVVIAAVVVVVAGLCVPGSAALAAATEPGACSGIAPAISAAIVVAVDRGISIWWQKTCGGVQTFPDSGVG